MRSLEKEKSHIVCIKTFEQETGGNKLSNDAGKAFFLLSSSSWF